MKMDASLNEFDESINSCLRVRQPDFATRLVQRFLLHLRTGVHAMVQVQ